MEQRGLRDWLVCGEVGEGGGMGKRRASASESW